MENCYLKMRDGEKIFIQYWHKQESNANLLYVHGGPGRGCWDFEYDAQKLSETCNVIMYDQRGVLRSNAITDSFSSELLIDDIEEYESILILINLYYAVIPMVDTLFYDML